MEVLSNEPFTMLESFTYLHVCNVHKDDWIEIYGYWNEACHNVIDDNPFIFSDLFIMSSLFYNE